MYKITKITTYKTLHRPHRQQLTHREWEGHAQLRIGYIGARRCCGEAGPGRRWANDRGADV